MNNPSQSTYSLLVRAEQEEKGRGVLETVLYALFILSAVVSIWQFSLQPVTVPGAGIEKTTDVVSRSAPGETSA